jgi:hypothetical protein
MATIFGGRLTTWLSATVSHRSTVHLYNAGSFDYELSYHWYLKGDFAWK